MKFVVLLAFILHTVPSFSQVKRYDIIIDEIMADPSPQVGLPDAEYLELKNISATAVNLSGWKVLHAANISRINNSFILQPDSFVIICSNAAASVLSAYGSTIGVPNFSLHNGENLITLMSEQGAIIHAIQYTRQQYRNPVKANGGWSLEMIDTHEPCTRQSNWNPSINGLGGTPGKTNSTDAVNHDVTAPMLQNYFMTDSSTILLQFNEPLDDAYAVIQQYLITPVTPVSGSLLPPLFNTVSLKAADYFKRDTLYTLQVPPLKDCRGNSTAEIILKTGLASKPGKSAVLINEILVNPKASGVDYIEVYNNSRSIIDLRSLFLTNRSPNGMLNQPVQVSREPRMLYPAAYSVLTEDTVMLQLDFPVAGSMIEISDLPSLPDDKGTIVLLNSTGDIIDELKYDEDWHFDLLNFHDGIALERMDFNKPTQDPMNWHSAASTAGYGTPGSKNSQYYASDLSGQTIRLPSTVFSPDNNGYEDFLIINYTFPQAGYVMNISAYDFSGRLVRLITRNALCGMNGYFLWDGLDDKSNPLKKGIYVLLIEYFSLHGKKGKTKKSVTLAREF